MSGLCGWFQPAECPADMPDSIGAMASTLTRFDATPLRTAAAGWGGVAIAARPAAGSVFQDRNRVAAIFGQARFADRHLSELALRHGSAYALAAGYERSQGDVMALLKGSFALAVLDHASGKALLATDRMGTRSLFYGTVQGTLVFGTTLDAINAFSGAPAEINPQAIYHYVHFHMVPGPQTIYADRHRLPSATALTWENGHIRTTRYWEMRFVEDAHRPFDELKENFVQLLRKSVSDAAAEGTVGTFLSGGTDSSTVAGMLREVTGRAPRTYSIGFDAQGFDEIGYARIAAQHFGTQHHEYYLRPEDVVAAIPRIAAIHDQPFGNSSAVPTYYCARLAKENGVEALLGGDGGDELFGGNARYAMQQLYSLYSDLPSTVRKGLIEPVLLAMPAISVVGKAQRYIRTASQPMPARYDNYNLLERLGPENVFNADFLDAVDADEPRRQCAGEYGGAQAESLINRMLAFDLKYTLADNDLPKVTRSCELAGIEARFPLLDDALVGFAASLAPELKLKGMTLRYFFKQALQGWLPPEIIAKKKHGFGMPFGTWLQAHKPLEQVVLDSLADLKRRRIIRLEFIEQLTSNYLQRHAEYFGTMVWVLMLLEQWFKRHRVAA